MYSLLQSSVGAACWSLVICRSYGAEKMFWDGIYRYFVPTELVERLPLKDRRLSTLYFLIKKSSITSISNPLLLNVR